MLKNYDQVLKLDGEVGVKGKYDPRAWLKLAENGLKNRMIKACEDLKSVGTTIFKR
jgi:fructose-bisphosphate aldolase class II